MKKTFNTSKLIICIVLLVTLLFPTAWSSNVTDEEKAKRVSDAQMEILTNTGIKYGMSPIFAESVKEGTYDITAYSSSAYFKVTNAKLTVEGGKMNVRFTIPSMSYVYVYAGTAKEAENASESEWIKFEEEKGCTVFTIPVSALDAKVQCAAYSKAKKRWYSRTLCFDASTLPKDALNITLPDFELIEEAIKAYEVVGSEELKKKRQEAAASLQPVTMDLNDGDYSIEVNMTGGSGRASISSPTLLTIKDGKAYATLMWSSTYYDYMIIDGAYFYNTNESGGPSTFEIPITALDEPIDIVADTTAMGDPVEINYILTFYEESVGDKGSVPQESAKLVLLIAGLIIILGGILNYFIKKKRAK
ncbi:MAG: hypothetical protein IK152_05625 [Lachnospiraceae bacterium]|nr:hypothetical protein [Lachnospiraceae bacterium]